MNHHKDPQCRMSDAEVMTTALVAAFCFGGNRSQACRWLAEPRYIPNMLSKSRFNRRLHRIKPLFLTLFACLAEVWKDLNADCIYSIDTFPIPVCDNIRISRARVYQGEAYRGYIPGKRRYFYASSSICWSRQKDNPSSSFSRRAPGVTSVALTSSICLPIQPSMPIEPTKLLLGGPAARSLSDLIAAHAQERLKVSFPTLDPLLATLLPQEDRNLRQFA